MIKNIFAVLSILICVSCGKETKGNLTVSGNINGLKEGIIYLQKIQDTILTNLDSLVVDGNANFKFTTTINEPELLFLYLDKKDHNDFNDRIDFFAEPGEIIINSTLRRFVKDVQISGSKSHEDLKELKGFITQFNLKNLALTRERTEAEKNNDDEKYAEVNLKITQNEITKFKYLRNYAFTNNNKAVTPYIIMKEAYYANPTLLDTIYKVLTPKIANSKYGKELKKMIDSELKE